MNRRREEFESSLLHRWKEIEKLDNADDDIAEEKFIRLKESWFSDAYRFLQGLPQEEHCWCRHNDITWPLLETFYNYFDASETKTLLSSLWKRFSCELRICIHCVVQYHNAKEFYKSEFPEDAVKLLLEVLQMLDEERVAEHIKSTLQRVKGNIHGVNGSSEEVVSVLFEVLMFPSLLEDAEINSAIAPFLLHVESSHELTLEDDQHYPGVYALLFHSSQDVRGVAHRMASSARKLRNAHDMQPIQPLLQKYMHRLEFDMFEDKRPDNTRGTVNAKNSKLTEASFLGKSTRARSRPRASFKKDCLWIGMKTLLGLLEPLAFEDGVVEQYPSFVSIVLNHVSEATSVFWNALHCLKLLLEALGYKLWLKTTFSPGVMRNTLLGQCFHTREEKMHKAIFDLFQPFLQSLEALQDGEHERQCQNLLYFLLQQVPHSSNFSSLMSKMAKQIAFNIILQQYNMDPPSPPVDCVHMWGPALVDAIKDLSLYTPIRQSAILLMQTIIVSDAIALACLSLRSSLDEASNLLEKDDEEDSDMIDVGMTRDSCWLYFKKTEKLVASDCSGWLCCPLLWKETFEVVMPSCMTVSFSQAVFWALSQLSLIPQTAHNIPFDPSLGFGSSNMRELTCAFQWEKPKGCDDVVNGRICSNSLKAQAWSLPLARVFRQSAEVYMGRLWDSRALEQWFWEPYIAEPITLLLFDSNEKLRDFNRRILSHFAKNSSLDSGLEFLYTDHLASDFVCRAFRLAIKMLMTSMLAESSHNFQHLFFIMWKVFTAEQKLDGDNRSSIKLCEVVKSIEDGGFLKQPEYNIQCSFSNLDISSESKGSLLRKLCEQLLISLWSLLMKAIKEGRKLANDMAHSMTFARMFDLLPIVFSKLLKMKLECMLPSHEGSEGTESNLQWSSSTWLHELIEWGNVEAVTLHRRWKVASSSILNELAAGNAIFDSAIMSETRKKLEGCRLVDDVARTEVESVFSMLLHEKLQQCDVLAESQALRRVDGMGNKDIKQMPPRYTLEGKSASSYTRPDFIDLSDDVEDAVVSITCGKDATLSSSLEAKASSVLLPHVSDKDHTDFGSKKLEKPGAKPDEVHPSQPLKHRHPISVKRVGSQIPTLDKFFGTVKADKGIGDSLSIEHTSSSLSQENKELKNLKTLDWGSISVPQSPLPKASEKQAKTHVMGDTLSNEHTYSSSLSQRESNENKELKNLKRLDCGAISVPQSPLAKASEKQLEMHVTEVEEKLEVRQSSEADMVKSDSMLKSRENDAATDSLLRKLVSDLADDEEDPLEAALDAAASRAPPKSTLKITSVVPQSKRQLIRLQIPNEQTKNSLMRLNGSRARIVAPRLDEWYKRILALNYFEVVSPDPLNSHEDSSIGPLMRVPFTFQSSEHYVEVFRPLVLEEFKAQLQHTHEELLSSAGTVKGILKLMSLERVDEFQVCRFTSEAGEDGVARACFENDLLLFSRQPFPNTSRSTHFIGKVERRDRDNKSRSIVLVLKLFLHSGVGRLSKARRLLIDRSKWHIIKLMSITPQLREFQALSSTGNIPFFPIIMNPGRSSMAVGKGLSQTGVEGLKALPEKLLKQLKMVYNENQQKAISAALEKDLSLVQGPPGTGKTRTIAAILSVLLATSKSSCSNYHMTRKIASAQNVSSSVGVKKPVSRSAAIARSWQDAAFARQMMNEAMAASASEPATGANSKRGRVLVCAQSNAAVDELVSRICKDGLYDTNGCFFKPFLVRVGNVKMVHSDSLPVFIDTLVDERMNYNKQNEANKKDEDCMRTHVDLLRADLERVMESIKEHEAQRFRCSGNAEDEGRNDVADDEESSFKLEERKKAAKIAAEGERALNVKLNMLYKRRRQLCADLAMAEQEERKSTEESRVKRQLVKKEIIKEAEVVVTTLSGCGGDVYSVCMEAYNDKKASGSLSDCFFDAVVIDEAAQALEPATLIPLQLLKLSNAKCVMVGDPKQLPATVLSQLASKFSYECSMFERLQRAGHPVTLLSMQYRMHPNIRQFPSAHFYDNMLVDGDGLTAESRTASFHRDRLFGPYVFFDVIDGYEKTSSSSVSQSLSNEAEVDAAFEIFKTLQKSYPNENISGRVGIITPYKKQLSLLRDRFIRSLGPSVGEEIEFNTIDGFQGREVDILILSTVRAVSGNQVTASYNRIGFVADVRRMNVALTRARFSLWIVGNATTLQTSPPWAALLSDARGRGLICTLKKPYRDMLSSSHFSSQPPHPARPKCIVDNRKAMEANRRGETRQVLQENNRAEEYLRSSSTGQDSSGHSTEVKTATTAKSVDALAHDIEEDSKLKMAAKDMGQREAASECHKTSNMRQKRSVRFIDQPSSGKEDSKNIRNAGGGSSNLVNAPRSALRQKGSSIQHEKNEDNPKDDTSSKTNEMLTNTNNPGAADISGTGRVKQLKRSRAVDPKRLTDCDNRKSIESIPRAASVMVDGTTIIASSRCRMSTEAKLSSNPGLINENDGAIGPSQSNPSNDTSGVDGGRLDTKKQHRKNEYGGVRNDHNPGLPLSMNEGSIVTSNVCDSRSRSSAGVKSQQGDKQERKHVSLSGASVDSTIVSKSDNVPLNTDLQSNNINSISMPEMGTKPANELGCRTVVAEKQVVSLTEDELCRNRKRRREQVEAMMPAGMFLPSRKPDASLGKAKLAIDNRNPKQQPAAYSGKNKPDKTTVLLEREACIDKGRPNPSSVHGGSYSVASQPKVMASESKKNIGRKNLDNEWHLFEMALARSKSDNVPTHSVQTTSKEMGSNRSSENTSVDDILSGMANVSRAQVQGRKEQPSYASKAKTTVPKSKS